MVEVDFSLYHSIIYGELKPNLQQWCTTTVFKEVSPLLPSIIYKKVEYEIHYMLDDDTCVDGEIIYSGMQEMNIKQEVADNAIKSNGGDENASVDPMEFFIPIPKNEKEKFYLFIIKKEHKRLCRTFADYFSQSKNSDELKFFTSKTIQQLKHLAKEARSYQAHMELSKMDDLENDNDYVILVLKEYLVRLIDFIQNLFLPFLAAPFQYHDELYLELYADTYVQESKVELGEMFRNSKALNSLDSIEKYINNALFEGYMFIKSNQTTVKSYNLLYAFERFKQELVKFEKFTSNNRKLFACYFYILDNLLSEFQLTIENQTSTIENKNFKALISHASKLTANRDKYEHLFIANFESKAISILDLITNKSLLDVETETAQSQDDTGLLNKNGTPATSFTYTHYNTNPGNLTNLFNSLKKHKFINEATPLKVFKKLFSGSVIEQPVIWTGNPSDLYYFITTLYTVQKKVKDVKQKQWDIAIKCFYTPENKPFNKSELRLLKKPKTTATLIETIVGQL